MESVKEKVAFMRQQEFFDVVKINQNVQRYMDRLDLWFAGH